MKESVVDTDILSAFLRGNQKVMAKFEEYINEFGLVNLTIITYYEMLNGLLYKDAKKQLAQFVEFVSLNRVIPLLLPAAKIAAEQYAKLRASGLEIGHTDTLIAGIALHSGLQVVTNNTAHFLRIDGLEIDNWMDLI